MGDHEDGFLAFSQSTSGDFQSPGGQSQQRNYYHNRHNRSRPGFGWQNNQQQYQSPNYRHNNRGRGRGRGFHSGHHSGHKGNQSFGDKRNETYNVQDYIHPSMWEDPWAHLVRKREFDEAQIPDTADKKVKLSKPEEDDEIMLDPEDVTDNLKQIIDGGEGEEEVSHARDEVKVGDSKEDSSDDDDNDDEDDDSSSGDSGNEDSADSPEGLKVYD